MQLVGIGAAPGIAIGPIWCPRTAAAVAAADASGPTPALDPDALAAVAEEQLEALAASLRSAGRAEEAGIFDAQALMATDPTLIAEWRTHLTAGAEPATAIREAAAALADTLAGLDDELLASRAADVRDVGERIARLVNGEVIDEPDRPSIALADDLSPSVTAEIPPGLLLGIALERGSRTAHAAILARSLGIPCIVGVEGLLRAADAVAPAAVGPPEVAVDGSTGDVILAPTTAEVAALHDRERAAAGAEALARRFRDRPSTTADGEPVALLANIGRPADAERALAMGAAGVGLFRTEFLFMGHQTAPTEAEQVDAYRRVFEAFGPGRPVVVRLADIGGDKDIPYLALPGEANPFLGVRALRLAYRDRGLLVRQIRAISAAAALAGVLPHVMAPMVATIDDVDLLHDLIAEAQSDLAASGSARSQRIVTGIMVEIPAAALSAGELAPHVDFFSIGTNDLTQYLMAADRTNPALVRLHDALHPAVLRCIAMVVDGADRIGIPVAVCGELAGDPVGALVLVGLGVDELSADAGSLDGLRFQLAGVTRADLDELARRALAARDGTEVRALASSLLGRAAHLLEATPA